ncbi:MAG: DNA-processing protein DprA [Candidatus Paceibacterota bacterium]
MIGILEKYPIKQIVVKEVFPALSEIPSPPKTLYIRGTLPHKDFILLTVVGSRKISPYGKEAIRKIISGLKGYPIVIVSGLALGVDSEAHLIALDIGCPTIAIPGSGLDESVIYPRMHLNLAKRILDTGGCLLSEFNPDEKAAIWTFPKRNRIMAGIARATLVIEAEKPSGTLITSKLATDFGRDVFAVPGSIFSKNSLGPHMLIKLGATPIENSEDILEAFGFDISKKDNSLSLLELSEEEKELIKILSSPKTRDEIINELNWNISKISEILTLLEIKGFIKESVGKIYLI